MDNLELYIESLIFTTTKAIAVKEIKQTLDSHFDSKFKEKEINDILDKLSAKYADDKYPFEIKPIADGYQFMTKGTYYPLVGQFLRLESKKKLSKAALETLAIISYKQPITKSVMESIRGVSCDYSVTKLLEKELIMISGRADGPGRPLLYGTTDKFMNHFGLKSLKDLPKIKEFEIPDNVVGVQSDDDPVPSDALAAQKESDDIEEHKSKENAEHESTAIDLDAQEGGAPQTTEADTLEHEEQVIDEEIGEIEVAKQDSNEAEGSAEAESTENETNPEPITDEPQVADSVIEEAPIVVISDEEE